MRVTIYQPRYFPQLHYFNRILNADTFVILEGAQYTKSLVHLTSNGKERRRSYQSDTPIKLSSGEYLLTIPVKHEGLLPINKTKIDYSHKWISKHLAIIKSAYGKAELLDVLFPQVETILLKKYDTLAALNITTIIWGISSILGFDLNSSNLTLEKLNEKLKSTENTRLKKVITDKEVNVQRPEGLQKGTEWTATICEALGATEYYHGGTAGASYIEPEFYGKKGIDLVTQSWECKVYKQQFNDRVSFIPNLSILDLLFNVDQKGTSSLVISNGA